MLFDCALTRQIKVKRGNFHEHSPILHNVATTVPNWAKVNQGLQKMYAAEVLKKFPVVQHLLFGSLLRFDATTSQNALLQAGGPTGAPVTASMPPPLLGVMPTRR